MEDPDAFHQDKHSRDVVEKHEQLPPTPPSTDDNASTTSTQSDDVEIPLPPPTYVPSRVLDQDKKTPDAHVPRDPRLIRLTGVHPFNVEAPLSALFNEGFLTSPELFYVRNHGAVPEVKESDIPDWEFSVEGYARHFEVATFCLIQALQACREALEPNITTAHRRVRTENLPHHIGLRWQPTKRAEPGEKEQRILLGKCRCFHSIVYRRCNGGSDT